MPLGDGPGGLGRQHEVMSPTFLRGCLAETAVAAMTEYTTGMFEPDKGYIDRDVAAFLLDCFTRLDSLGGQQKTCFDQTKRRFAFVPLQDYKQRYIDELFNRAADTITLRGLTDME